MRTESAIWKSEAGEYGPALAPSTARTRQK